MTPPPRTAAARAAPTLRGLAAWFLVWLVLPRAVGPLVARVTGPPPRLPPGAHRLLPALLVPGDLTVILSALLAATLLVATEAAPPTPRRVLARSNLPTAARAWRLLPLGALAGVATMTLVLAAMALCGGARFALSPEPPTAIARTVAVFAPVFLLVALAEELWNRGYPLRALAEGLGFWPAALLTSTLFALTHVVEGDPWYGALGTGLRGLFLCLTWRRTGSLAFAIGFHAAWDFTETALAGVPDSSFTVAHALLVPTLAGPTILTGGPVGPEGSLLAYGATALLLAAALALPPRRSAR